MDQYFRSKEAGLTGDQSSRAVVNPVLHETDPYPSLTIVTDKLYGPAEKKKLVRDLRQAHKNLGIMGEVSFRLLYALRYKMSDSERKRGAQKDTLADAAIDFSTYVKPGSKIIAIGRSMQALTRNAELNSFTFSDVLFNKGYCYIPYLQSYAWRIDQIYSWSENSEDVWERNFALHQIVDALSTPVHPPRPYSLQYEIVDNPNEFLRAHSDNTAYPKVAWDLETGGLNYMKDEIRCITLSFDGHRGYYLRWEEVERETLDEFLRGKFQILANGKFDCRFLRYLGLNGGKIDFDTYYAGHVLNEMRSNSLKTHAWLYTMYGGYEQPLEDYKAHYPRASYLDIPESIIVPYATTDSIVTMQLYLQMSQQIEDISNNPNTYPSIAGQLTLREYYYDMVIPMVNELVAIEMEGMEVDWGRVEEVGERFRQSIRDTKAALAEALGIKEKKQSASALFAPANSSSREVEYEINLSSNPQLADYLEAAGWPDMGRGKNGKYLVNDDTLQRWIAAGYEDAKLIRRLHELETLYGTFIGDERGGTGFWQYRNSDNRVHPSFGAMAADSGRNTCRNPNLQNIPKNSNVTFPDVFYITDEDTGKEFIFTDREQKVSIIRDGQRVTVAVGDLRETDSHLQVT